MSTRSVDIEQDEEALVSQGAESTENIPKSKGEFDWAAYAIFVLLGIGVLFPWNAVVLAVDYFTDLYVDASTFLFLTAIFYTAPQVPANLVVVWRGEGVPVRFRLWGAMAVMIASMIMMPLVAPTGQAGAAVLIVLMGAATAVFQPSLFGLASQFPGMYTQAQMTGQGVAGIVASLVRIITKAAIPKNAKSTAPTIAFFVVAAVILAAGGFGLLYLLRSEFALKHLSHASGRPPEVEEHDVLLRGPAESVAKADTPKLGRKDEPLLTEEESGKVTMSVWSRAYVIRFPLFSVFFAFFVTFIVFPGVIDSIPYYKTVGIPSLAKAEWWSIILLLLFNICDTAGRYTANMIPWGPKTTCIAAVLRTLTIPFFFLLASKIGGVFFKNDITSFVVMIIYAYTNGLTSSRSLIIAPELVQPHEREAVGFLMGLALQGGILLGAVIGILISKT